MQQAATHEQEEIFRNGIWKLKYRTSLSDEHLQSISMTSNTKFEDQFKNNFSLQKKYNRSH